MLNTDNLSRIASALAELVDSVCTEYPSGHKTCSEVNALAYLLCAAGYEKQSVSALARHAFNDEPGDEHYVRSDGTVSMDVDDDDDGDTGWTDEDAVWNAMREYVKSWNA